VLTWDGTKWAPAAPTAPWNVQGGTTQATTNTQNIYTQGTVAVGTSNPHTSSALQIDATNKAFLGPRVVLTSPTDIITVPNPEPGMMVFNLGTNPGLPFPGYVFWDGTEWMSFLRGSMVPGTVGSLVCNGVTMSPSVYATGEPFDGVMIVPYTSGSGGVYSAQSIGPINGLTATLAAGNFAIGSGNLAYSITGTPTVTTPVVTEFPITIGGKTCTATVGAGDGIAAGELVFYKTPPFSATFGSGGETAETAINWMSYYVDDLPIIAGKLRLDGYFMAGTGGIGLWPFIPRLVNVSSSNVKFTFSAITPVTQYNASNIVIRPGAWVNLDNGIYHNYGHNRTMSTPMTTNNGNVPTPGTTHTEILSVDIIVDGDWYRIHYFPIIDNNDQTLVANMHRVVYLSIQRLY
jgi:hypothetical protein